MILELIRRVEVIPRLPVRPHKVQLVLERVVPVGRSGHLAAEHDKRLAVLLPGQAAGQVGGAAVERVVPWCGPV